MEHPRSSVDYQTLERDQQAMTELARHVASCLNYMCRDTTSGRMAFCAALECEHRTLQQAFTRLCVAWLLYAAHPGYRYDERNEATHTLAQTLEPQLAEHALPLI